MSKEEVHPFIGSNDEFSIPHFGLDIPYRSKAKIEEDRKKAIRKQIRRLKKELNDE